MNTDNSEFVLYKSFTDKGSVYVMSGLDKNKPDYEDLLSIACILAENGKTVHILSPLHYKDPTDNNVYGSLIGTEYYRKCPDLLIDGEFCEYESYERPFEMERIERMVARGSKQSSQIVIDVRDSSATKKVVYDRIKRLIAQKTFKGILSKVWIYNGSTVEIVYKNK